ncbi:uncharacterized protein DDB_G0271670-like [Carica papaya]|uniref:uncharacterized protein DDB_G0271670-like n=1 Tax=Carica papaya TaxID=3649 RepID=UPI000B8C859D|nr:uncharacterized protein DDB_G0271670-like [Carica papaya]XP_021906341.1 uncharacterized protein DDB_G0271670-like [Carica papaya]XP_021906342.1 uncharacterized protein DDB_G0271670-like [Carica papaya]
MASACVNNIGMSPENFSPATYPSYGWLSPRISFSREEESSSCTITSGNGIKPMPQPSKPDHPVSDQLEIQDPGDFEFRLDDPVAMLPADELFSDGKLVPLQLSTMKQPVTVLTEVRSPDAVKACRRTEMEISTTDPYLFSPKAPRCSSRWRELLGLKKFSQSVSVKTEPQKTTSSSSSGVNPKSLKYFLHRSSKSSTSSSASSLETSLSLPLLKDSDCESLSISSSRLSLSSSSSGHEHDDLPRLSLDSEKPGVNANMSPNPFAPSRSLNPNPPRMRMVKPRAGVGSSENGQTATGRMGRSPMRRSAGEAGGVGSRGASVDSPRMNSSGKIVFQSLERSSSSPSSFNGGPRLKHRGMERSYSANVRVTPVLNVPVCSLRGSSKSVSVFGFGQLFSSPQKTTVGGHRGQQSNSGKNR